MRLQISIPASQLKPGDEIEAYDGRRDVGKVEKDFGDMFHTVEVGVWWEEEYMPTGYAPEPDLKLSKDLNLVVWRWV